MFLLPKVLFRKQAIGLVCSLSFSVVENRGGDHHRPFFLLSQRRFGCQIEPSLCASHSGLQTSYPGCPCLQTVCHFSHSSSLASSARKFSGYFSRFPLLSTTVFLVGTSLCPFSVSNCRSQRKSPGRTLRIFSTAMHLYCVVIFRFSVFRFGAATAASPVSRLSQSRGRSQSHSVWGIATRVLRIEIWNRLRHSHQSTILR